MAKRSKRERRVIKPSRRGDFGTRANLLTGQGPVVVELPRLPMAGLQLLMRRVDLLSLAASGRWPQPISARVAKIVAEGVGGQAGRAVQSDDAAADLVRLQEAAAAIARASIIVPPDEFLDGEIDAEDITREMCRPLFVTPGEAPDGDQLILVPTIGDGGIEGDVCYLHPTDLNQLATLAYLFGAGALRFFRLAGGGVPGAAVEPVGEVEAADAEAE